MLVPFQLIGIAFKRIRDNVYVASGYSGGGVICYAVANHKAFIGAAAKFMHYLAIEIRIGLTICRIGIIGHEIEILTLQIEPAQARIRAIRGKHGVIGEHYAVALSMQHIYERLSVHADSEYILYTVELVAIEFVTDRLHIAYLFA